MNNQEKIYCNFGSYYNIKSLPPLPEYGLCKEIYDKIEFMINPIKHLRENDFNELPEDYKQLIWQHYDSSESNAEQMVKSVINLPQLTESNDNQKTK